MTDRPILFNAEMVSAILDGRKTQTRRVIKPQPDYSILKDGVTLEAHKCPVLGPSHYGRKEWGLYCAPYKPSDVPVLAFDCPYGVPGDRLWVRETIFTDMADGIGLVWNHCTRPSTGFKLWKGKEPKRFGVKIPAIFMPRWASRITLEVTDVRVERVQEISEEDVRAEGVTPLPEFGEEYTNWHLDAFATLWDSINAKRGFGWNVNPWVRVIEFKPKGSEQ